MKITPNLDYDLLKKASEETAEIEYNGRIYKIEFYEEGGHNLWQLSVNEINPETKENIKEIYSSIDLDEITQLFEDGFLNFRRPESFIKYLDDMGKIDKTEPVSKSEKWEERWHKRSNIKCAVREEEWRVYTYDVLGNDEDGYEVNNVYPGRVVKLPAKVNLEQIIDILKDAGYLNSHASTEDVYDDSNSEDVIYLSEISNACPILELRRISPSAEEQEKTEKWEERWHKRSDTDEQHKLITNDDLSNIVVDDKNIML